MAPVADDGSDPLASFPTLGVEQRGAVGVVRLDRPDRLNAIGRQTVRDLHDACDLLSGDPTVAAVVFTGEGRAFSAGADISEISPLDGPRELLGFIREIQGAYDRIDEMTEPTIAAINGIAFGGGCELALACDLRVMATDAALGVPEVKLGVLPGAGGTQRLPRLLPEAVAKQMLLFGDPLPAEDALRHGAVNEVVEAAAVLTTAVAWAQRLAALPPLAVSAAKELVRVARDSDLPSGLLTEQQAVALLFETDDAREGMRAFLEKRDASFTGR
jgi:enoyl-CoA hydratase